jgi:hypothetical protein
MENNTYQFSEKEKLYFNRLQQEFNAGVSAGIRLIMTQQDLEGQWRVKADGSGLELPEHNAPQMVPSEIAELEKKVNGLA